MYYFLRVLFSISVLLSTEINGAERSSIQDKALRPLLDLLSEIEQTPKALNERFIQVQGKSYWHIPVNSEVNQFNSDSIVMQKVLDEVISQIFSSPFGQSICQKIFGSQKEVIERVTGVSAKASVHIAESCQADSVTDAIQSRDWIIQSSPDEIQKKLVENLIQEGEGESLIETSKGKDLPKRSYEVYIGNQESDEKKLAFNSYTGRLGRKTVLILNIPFWDRSQVNIEILYERILRMIAHEVFGIFLDQKQQLKYSLQNIFKIKSWANPHAPELNLDQLLKIAGSYPFFQVFKSMRAFIVEEEIIQSVFNLFGLKPSFKINWGQWFESPSSCIDTMKLINEDFQSLYMHFYFRDRYRHLFLREPIAQKEMYIVDSRITALYLKWIEWNGVDFDSQVFGQDLLIPIESTGLTLRVLNDVKYNLDLLDLTSKVGSLEILKESIITNEEGQRENFCKYMATPLLSGEYLWVQGGPRPWITGGNFIIQPADVSVDGKQELKLEEESN